MRPLFRPLLCSVLALGSCSTAAQREFKATNEAGKSASDAFIECRAAVDGNPAYAGLATHLALSSTPPTLTQLADTALPSPQDISALDSWHSGVQTCRERLIASAQESFSFMVPAYQQNYMSLDAIYLKLAKGEVSFGEANSELAQARVQASARSREAANEWRSGLNEENREELASRAAAFQAMATSFQQAGAAMQQQAQQQQLINAINRPLTTNCNRFVNSTSCTTQ